MVWTGRNVIVWGGVIGPDAGAWVSDGSYSIQGLHPSATGARLRPDTGTWLPLPQLPTARTFTVSSPPPQSDVNDGVKRVLEFTFHFSPPLGAEPVWIEYLVTQVPGYLLANAGLDFTVDSKNSASDQVHRPGFIRFRQPGAAAVPLRFTVLYDFIYEPEERFQLEFPHTQGATFTGPNPVARIINAPHPIIMHLETLAAGGHVVKGTRRSLDTDLSYKQYTYSAIGLEGNWGVNPSFVKNDLERADYDGTGNFHEVIIGSGSGVPPSVAVFKFDLTLRKWIKFFEIPVYRETGWTGGVNVAVGDVDGDGYRDIITAPRSGRPSRVIAWNWGAVVRGEGLKTIYDRVLYPTWMGGCSVAAGDVDGDGTAEIITGALAGGWPHVLVVDPVPPPGGAEGLFSRFVFRDDFQGGVQVGACDYDSNGRFDIIVGQTRRWY
jgi:FG-GAP repeat